MILSLHRAKIRQIIWLMAAGICMLMLARSVIASALSNVGILAIERGIGATLDLPGIDAERAVDWLETAVTWDSHEAVLLPRRKGVALLCAGQPRQALEFLLRAAEDRQDVLANYWLGICYEQLGDFDRAAHAWLSVNFQRTLLQRANDWLAVGKIEQAGSIYAEILKIEPESILALLGQGRVAEAHGDWARAAAAFDKVLVVAPGHSQGLIERGVVYYYGEHRIDSAVAEFDRAIQLDPQCYWCYLVYADVARDAGRFEAAIRVLNLARSRGFQQDSLIYRKLAQIYMDDLDEPANAQAVSRQGLKLYVKDADLYYWLGRAEEKLGNHEAALLALEQAVTLAPDVAEYQSALKQVK